ncbi:MAG TPA: hypothetical protein PKN29_13170 [Candidatus Ozemobacteraceae bacterium]|nr:hypothetical protein [Candidatus Ozemobacteraceae bacterium]
MFKTINTYLHLLLAASLLLISALAVHAGPVPPGEGWRVDADYGFSIGILPSAAATDVAKPVEVVEPLGFVATYAADITNIAYSGFKSMGFSIPEVDDPAGMNYFIKLYRFPEKIRHLPIIAPLPADFGINKIIGGSEISTFMADRRNLVVKMGLIDASGRQFTEQAPFPSLLVKNAGQAEQKSFLASILFYSIYLRPRPLPGITAEARPGTVEHSMLGVTAFHQALLQACEKNFQTLKSDDESYHCYLRHYAPGRAQILRVMKNPLQFKDNWKTLPMPHGPTKFLSSLLLLISDEYTSKTAKSAPEELTTPFFKANWQPARRTIFEVGSIFDSATQAEKH